MKKLAAVLLGCVMTLNFAAFGDTKPADQKWLDAVEKMVAQGEKRVSTPSQDRANLLKEWGAKKGYSVRVTKTDSGFAIEVSKSLASK